jgi:hypothetical protein
MARLLAIATWGLAAVLASPAGAAFPGRNGRLVVVPRHGQGLALVDPRSGVAQLICTDSTLCGKPGQARWSPDGQELAFVDAVSSRLVIVASDGTCMWCLLGAPLSTLQARSPAFTTSGTAVTFGVGGRRAQPGLWQLGLTGADGRLVVRGRVTDAVWSAKGRLALVRGGSVWIGRSSGKQLRRLAPGGSPSWSPDGSRLALVRHGWVWVVQVRNDRSRLLVRGSFPAWSPDGRLIAYLGPGNDVDVVAAGGGHPRRVGALTGSAVDWQPLPLSRGRSCKPPSGSQVLAKDQQAIVTTSTSQDGIAQTVRGCLHAIGRQRMLYSGMSAAGCYAGTSVSHVELAGRFAALQFFGCDHYGACNNSISIVDLSRDGSTPLSSQDCSGEYGGGGLDALSVDSSGFAAWRALNRVVPYRPLNAVSCPTASLCGAVDGAGDILGSADPTANATTAWTTAPVDVPVCAPATPCVSEQLLAHDDRGTRVIDSAPPGSGQSIANVGMSGNSLLLTWTRNGGSYQAALR